MPRASALLVAGLVFSLLSHEAGAASPRRRTPPRPLRGCGGVGKCKFTPPPHPTIPPPRSLCEERFRDAPLDHFSFGDKFADTYRQRYFFCPHFWLKHRRRLGGDGGGDDDLDAEDAEDPPIFFYTGNEANVELYLNATGIMWESAQRFNAILVFAEHRYYGESLPKEKSVHSTASASASVSAALTTSTSTSTSTTSTTTTTSLREDVDELEGIDGAASRAKAGQATRGGIPARRRSLAHLTSEQALADYATLIRDVKREIGAPDAPVIAFGGSYGGMLSTWLRVKYPFAVDGAVAGSAPIWSFEGEDPPADPGAFAKGVTWDATAAGGSPLSCADNIRAAWREMLGRIPETTNAAAAAAAAAAVARANTHAKAAAAAGNAAGAAGTTTATERTPPPTTTTTVTVAPLPAAAVLATARELGDDATTPRDGGGGGGGRSSPSRSSIASIAAPLRLCPRQPLSTPAHLTAVMYWLQDAFDYLAMGNYPYRSSYILNGDGTLPPYPFREACAGAIANPSLAAIGGDALLSALADAVSVFYNYTGDKPCFNYTQGVNPSTEEDGDTWGYQYCTEMFMPMGRDGVEDMFWPQPWNRSEAIAECEAQWGVSPRTLWADTVFGGRRLEAASNIVWSNGDLDPWARLGVTSSLSPSLRAVVIRVGGVDHVSVR